MIALATVTGCFGSKSRGPSDPTVEQAQKGVERATTSIADYRGPATGSRAQRPRLVVFIAADLTNGGVAGVARGVQQAARTIGWPLRILDGQASKGGHRSALRTAIDLKPGGIILGGFDASEQRKLMRRAHEHHIPVVGWHAGTLPGPDPRNRLFTNVTTDPDEVARLAVRYVIADSGGNAGAVIFTDSEFAIAMRKARVMRAELRSCRRCAELQTVDMPIAEAQVNMPTAVTAFVQHYGARFRYLLAINGAYIAGARAGLVGAGRRPGDPPFGVAAGDGDASEFERIRAGDYQRASIAEPLYLQGWQLVDELNRARAGQPASAYVAPPRLITRDNVPDSNVFDPPGGYRANYERIWGR
ncbi:substrate-binding domain-containing protein [Solirubrobacter ginsenosidimutans]|uniref:Substrate-binding domain-containing protein n=1 Tax=Solirubrobacter ginsenosidimutans TaxID=490573 RepID=A0A9X3N0K7_9ACTN|nr:substrate-binding domain-containing protein [Solirubrobacter ginsenosidimutans]MDA0162623.1 substrate-binding domain-containing protein [Solirubrobacter ginsenosidimutans]